MEEPTAGKLDPLSLPDCGKGCWGEDAEALEGRPY